MNNVKDTYDKLQEALCEYVDAEVADRGRGTRFVEVDNYAPMIDPKLPDHVQDLPVTIEDILDVPGMPEPAENCTIEHYYPDLGVSLVMTGDLMTLADNEKTHIIAMMEQAIDDMLKGV